MNFPLMSSFVVDCRRGVGASAGQYTVNGPWHQHGTEQREAGTKAEVEDIGDQQGGLYCVAEPPHTVDMPGHIRASTYTHRCGSVLTQAGGGDLPTLHPGRMEEGRHVSTEGKR